MAKFFLLLCVALLLWLCVMPLNTLPMFFAGVFLAYLGLLLWGVLCILFEVLIGRK